MGVYRLLSRTEWRTREQLMRESGQGDRAVRREISELGKDPDTVVISSSHGKGYKLPASKEELITCRNEYKSREQEIHERVEVLDEAIRRWKDNSQEEQLTFGF